MCLGPDVGRVILDVSLCLLGLGFLLRERRNLSEYLSIYCSKNEAQICKSTGQALFQDGGAGPWGTPRKPWLHLR